MPPVWEHRYRLAGGVLLPLLNRTQTSQMGRFLICDRMETHMGFSLCVISGIAVVSFGVARLKARRSQKRNIQTLFNAAK